MAKKKYKETVASVVAVAVGAFLLGRAKRNQDSSIGAVRKTKVSDFYARRGNGYLSYYITYTSPVTGHEWEFHTHDEDEFELAKGWIDNPKQKDLDNLKWKCKNWGGRVK